MEVLPVHIHLNSDDESEGELEVKCRRRPRDECESEGEDEKTQEINNTPRSEDDGLYKNPPWKSDWYEQCQEEGVEDDANETFGSNSKLELCYSDCDERKLIFDGISESEGLGVNEKQPVVDNINGNIDGDAEGSNDHNNTPQDVAEQVDENNNTTFFSNSNMNLGDCMMVSDSNGYLLPQFSQSNLEYDTILSPDAELSLRPREYMNGPCVSPVSEYGSMINEDTGYEYGSNSQICNPPMIVPSDLCNDITSMLSVTPEQLQQNHINVFPTLLISQAGLISVILRQDVVVEMTVDRTLRVIDHSHKTVVAASSRGDTSCLNHTAARLYNQGTTTEADIFWDRRVKISPSGLTFASGKACFFLHPHGMVDVPPNFMDLSNDTSVTLLFANSTYGPHVVSELEQLVQEATYNFRPDGSFTVLINNVKIEQLCNDDVLVEHERKSLYVSPANHAAHVDTNYAELSVSKDWTVKLRRNVFQMVAGIRGMILSDGERECGFNSQRRVFVRPAFSMTETIIMDGESVDMCHAPPLPPPNFAPLPPHFRRLADYIPMQDEKQSNSEKTVSVSIQEILRREGESDEDYFERLKMYKSDQNCGGDDRSYSRAIRGGHGRGDSLKNISPR